MMANDRFWRKADIGPVRGEWLLWEKRTFRLGLGVLARHDGKASSPPARLA